jgi:hypothetical protein
LNSHEKSLFLTLLLLSGAPLGAEETKSAGPADQLWTRIGAAQKAPAPRVERDGNKFIYSREYFEITAQQGAATGDLLLEFVEKFPADPRYADAVIALTKTYRPVFKEIGDVRTKGAEAAGWHTRSSTGCRCRPACATSSARCRPSI